MIEITPLFEADLRDNKTGETQFCASMSPAKPSILDLPDDVVGLIAGSCSLGGLYNLCLSSKRFHHPTQLPSSMPRAGVDLQDFSLSGRLMYNALLNNLECALMGGSLKFLSSRPVVETFAELSRSLPRYSVAMSGSISAQAALGRVWKDGDVDIYVTPAEAPRVRDYLFDHGMVLVEYTNGNGANTHYDFAPWQDHVEKYKNALEVEILELNRIVDGDMVIETDSLDPILYAPGLSGGRSNIDLIILEEGAEISEAIESFDLEIVQSYWDGYSFWFRNASNSIGGRTKLTSIPRNVELLAYMDCLAKQNLFDAHSIVRNCVVAYCRMKGFDAHTFLSEQSCGFHGLQLTYELVSILVKDKARGITIPIREVVNLVASKGLFSRDLDPPNSSTGLDRGTVILLGVIHQIRMFFIWGLLDECGLGCTTSPFAEHNKFMKHFGRVMKYKRRGIDIEGDLGGYEWLAGVGLDRILPACYMESDDGARVDDDTDEWDEEDWEAHLQSEFRNNVEAGGVAYAQHWYENNREEYNRVLQRRFFIS